MIPLPVRYREAGKKDTSIRGVGASFQRFLAPSKIISRRRPSELNDHGNEAPRRHSRRSLCTNDSQLPYRLHSSSKPQCKLRIFFAPIQDFIFCCPKIYTIIKESLPWNILHRTIIVITSRSAFAFFDPFYVHFQCYGNTPSWLTHVFGHFDYSNIVPLTNEVSSWDDGLHGRFGLTRSRVVYGTQGSVGERFKSRTRDCKSVNLRVRAVWLTDPEEPPRNYSYCARGTGNQQPDGIPEHDKVVWLTDSEEIRSGMSHIALKGLTISNTHLEPSETQAWKGHICLSLEKTRRAKRKGFRRRAEKFGETFLQNTNPVSMRSGADL